MLRFAATLLGLACLLSALPISAQRAVIIGGRVFFVDNDHPAKGITVDILNVQHILITSQSTSDSGEFRFPYLNGGQYIVSVHVDNYYPVSLNIDLEFDVANGLLIYLKPIENKRKPGAEGATVSVHELSMPVKAREALTAGQKKLYQDKDGEGALRYFQQALSINPTYFEASYQEGMAYMTLGNLPEAEAAFRKCIESSGDTFASADIRLGSLLLDRSGLGGEELILKGIKLEPDFWLGHYELGRALLNQDRLLEALSSAEQAHLLAPGVPIVYRLLSNIHLRQKNYPALLQDLDAYIALDPSSPVGQRAKELRQQIQQQHPVQKQQYAPTYAHL